MSKFFQEKENQDIEPNFTEFCYLEGYYLKISYTQGISLFAYNLEILDGKRYETQINLPSLFKLNYKFKELKTTKDIYKYIVKLIQNHNFKITQNNDNLMIKLLIKEDLENTEVPFNLPVYDRKYGNYRNNEEYIKILTDEIIRLRKAKKEISELKEEENKNLINEVKELKDIIASNKNLSIYSDLNNGEKISIQDLNKKFKLSIPSIDIHILDLSDKKLGDEILNYLSHIGFNQLIRLFLGGKFYYTVFCNCEPFAIE